MKKTIIIILVTILSIFSIFASDSDLESWDGTYQWINHTDKNNDGKCTEITFIVKEVTLEDGSESFEVWEVMEDSSLGRLFPAEDEPEDGYKWHKWKEDSVVAENYRANALKFNTTSYTPSKWRVKEIIQEELFGSCKVETQAFIFTVNTVSTFELRYNSETGKQELAYKTTGDGLAKMGLFFNPEPGEEGKEVFVLTKVD